MLYEGRFFIVQVALLYSLHGAVRRVVHQGLELREGLDKRIALSSGDVSALSEAGNQLSSCFGEGWGGGREIVKFSRGWQGVVQFLWPPIWSLSWGELFRKGRARSRSACGPTL